MAFSNILTYDMAVKLLTYDPDTGLFVYNRRPGRNLFNAKFAGNPALATMNDQGYLFGSLNEKDYKAARVAWLITYKQWPTLQIDHINRVRHDNRIVNLRDVSGSVNSLNRDPKSY